MFPVLYIPVLAGINLIMFDSSISLLVRLLFAFYVTLASAKAAQEPLGGISVQKGYNVGQPIPVSCMNRSV